MVGNQVTDLDARIREAREWDLRRGSFLIVGKLADALETLRAERDAALAREAALMEALREIGRTAYLLAASVGRRAAAKPEASEDDLMQIADQMCGPRASAPPAAESEAVENG